MGLSRMYRVFPSASSALLCLMLTLPCSAEAADLSRIRSSGTLKLGFSTNTPGLLTQEGQKINGFAVELMGLIAKEMKVKTVSWKKVATQGGLLRDLAAGTFDAVFDARLPQVLSDVDQSAPLGCTGGVLFARPGGPSTQAGLKGAKIAMTTNDPYFNYIRNLPFEKNVNVFPTSDKGLLAFLLGSVDVLLLDRFDALKMYKKVGPEKLQVSPLLWSQPMYMVVKSGPDKEVTAAINTALKKIQANGTYAALSKKYFTQDVRCTE